MDKHDKVAIVSFIDVDTWNQAGWTGTVFAVDPDGEDVPCMGILFSNEAAGRKIFTNLIERLTNQDDAELLRVSIIEGDIPNEKAGYSVYLGTDYDNYVADLQRKGETFENLLAGMVGRFHRMHPVPGSPFLPGFKKSYEKHKKYLLFPAFGSPSNPRPEFKLSIGKRQINFLRADNLGQNDVERVVLKEGGTDKKAE
ncbi:MAG: hypothetical protein U0804_21625 [Gemmataceae bacterium]